MTRVLMIGKSGQLARSIAEVAAKRADVELIVLGRPEVDLLEPGTAAEAIHAYNPDLVINAAAYTEVDRAEDEPERAHRINADAAGEIASAAATAGAPIIHFSTDYVFDGLAANPYGEEASTNPINVYGRSKLAGEEQVKGATAAHLILRTSWVYSPFGRNFVTTMMSLAGTRDTLRVVDDQRGCPTSALDLAQAVVTIASKIDGRFGTFHLAGDGEASWCEFARQVMKEMGRLGLPTAEVIAIQSEDWPTSAARPRNSALDSAAFGRAFGLTMPGWKTSLAEVIERCARASDD